MSEGHFEIIAQGLVHMSVCTDLTLDAATARLNTEYPTGIASEWHKSDDRTFLQGEPNPCPCPQTPDAKHWLFSC